MIARSGGCERSVFGNGVEGVGFSPKAAGEEHNQFCISEDDSVVWLRKQVEKSSLKTAPLRCFCEDGGNSRDT